LKAANPRRDQSIRKRIAEKVDSGLYNSTSELVREGLRLLFAAEETKARRLDRMRADIDVGLEQLNRGEGIPGDRVLAEVTKCLQARRRR
jgi:antitoxin ParD1/3/4